VTWEKVKKPAGFIPSFKDEVIAPVFLEEISELQTGWPCAYDERINVSVHGTTPLVFINTTNKI
jgi:hypothetical protein